MMESVQPLAARMRPRQLDEFIGQSHLLAKNKPLRLAIEHKQIHSMIFWGPPGSGKTTLAKIIAENTGANFEMLSAVFSGVKDIRAAIERAQIAKAENKQTILFIDEVHRFNKTQQDAFLPYVEDGTIIFIGATTENPSFELINALLSRARVYVLKPLEKADLVAIIELACKDKQRGLGKLHLKIAEPLKEMIADAADGDARQALTLLEIAADLAEEEDHHAVITEKIVKGILQTSWRRFDKQGEAFYDQISALHKSVRGSDPDASLYWYCRMIDGGCDPLYIARRVVRMASEDIGNADPRALTIALEAWETYERLGSPEGELPIAQAILYLACAPKSNAVYTAYNDALQDVKKHGSFEVPLHLRNAPTKLMKQLGYGKTYRYPHDEPEAFAAGENYFPEEMSPKTYYHPVNRGLEIKIAEKLAHLQKLNKSRSSS